MVHLNWMCKIGGCLVACSSPLASIESQLHTPCSASNHAPSITDVSFTLIFSLHVWVRVGIPLNNNRSS